MIEFGIATKTPDLSVYVNLKLTEWGKGESWSSETPPSDTKLISLATHEWY